MMAADSVWHDGNLSLRDYRDLISTGRFWPLLGNSIGLALATTVVSGIAGIVLGVLFSKTDLPYRPVFLLLFTLPFVLPPYFFALGWTRLLTAAGFKSQVLFGFSGSVLVLASVFLPIVILLTFASCASVDQRLEEAGRLVSAWPRVLRRITIPLSAPGILFSLVLVFLLSIGEFSVPNFLRFQVLPVLSFTEFTASYDFGAATAAALPLAAIAVAGAVLEIAFLRERVFAYRGTAGVLRGNLRRWKWTAFMVVVVLCVVVVIAPLAALLADAFSSSALTEAFQRGRDSLSRSVVYSAIAASVLTAVGFLLGYFMRSRRASGVGLLTLALFAVPGTVLAIGLVRFWNTPYLGFIYATPALLMLGYCAQYAAVAARVVASGLFVIPMSFDEAARLSGASWARRLWRIHIPLAKRVMVCAWLAGFILCIRDVPIALIAAPPGRDVLPGRILTLMANGSPPLIAALCLMMVVAALVPLLILTWLIRPHDVAR
jgi:iron(III) transport system permease protein